MKSNQWHTVRVNEDEIAEAMISTAKQEGIIVSAAGDTALATVKNLFIWVTKKMRKILW